MSHSSCKFGSSYIYKALAGKGLHMADLQESSLSGSGVQEDGDPTDTPSVPLPISQQDGELIDEALVSDAPSELDQYPDDPLHISTHDQNTTSVSVNVAASELLAPPKSVAREYSSWFGDQEDDGIFPAFAISILPSVYSLAVVLSIAVYIYVHIDPLNIWSDQKDQKDIWSLISSYFTLAVTTCILWASPMIFYGDAYKTRLRGKRKLCLLILFCLCPTLFFGGAYYTIASNTNAGPENSIYSGMYKHGRVTTYGRLFQAWSTGIMPKLLQSQRCEARVSTQQLPLFASHIYASQFARTYTTPNNITELLPGVTFGSWRFYPAFNWENFEGVRYSQTLCYQGFEGNTDLYGLGIRGGLYFQWISSLLANNFQSSTRQDIQKVYLIFSLAICLATLIISFTKSCVFSIEIEIMYIIYWGGYMCVVGSAPCSIRLGSIGKWIQIDWTSTITFGTHWVMTYHGTWYVWYAYDQIFSRLPCGTYHFFFAPVLDPSLAYWTLRDCLSVLAVFWVAPLLVIFPLVGLLLIPEVKQAITSSATYRNFMPEEGALNDEEAEFVNANASSGKIPLRFRIYTMVSNIQSGFRRTFLLPAESRGGIRLVTPADIKQRR